MDDALELNLYLPLSFQNPNEQVYVRFLWEIFAELVAMGLRARLTATGAIGQCHDLVPAAIAL